jgi:DNA repair exonuclease SbcCD ATPase subunit
MVNTAVQLRNEIGELKLMHAKLSGQMSLVYKELQDFTVELAGIHETLEIIDKSRVFLQKVSEAARHVAKIQIEKIVTKALQYVFGPHYSFRIDVKYTVSRPEAEFLVITDYKNRTVESIPTSGKGGGIVDLLAVSLKFALLELFNYDGPIWMDEPFKHVSKDYIAEVGRLLAFMGETSQRQLVIITHNDGLAEMSNKCIRVLQKNGSSTVIYG